MTQVLRQPLSAATARQSVSDIRGGHAGAAAGEQPAQAFQGVLLRMSHLRDEEARAKAGQEEAEPVAEACVGVPLLHAPCPMRQTAEALASPEAPLPMRAVPVALDRMHGLQPSQTSGQNGNATSWHFGLPSGATTLVAMHLSTTPAGAWQMRMFADAAGNAALRPHLETLRQRLQAAGKNLDELFLLEDE
jgi:hypothetical protein